MQACRPKRGLQHRLSYHRGVVTDSPSAGVNTEQPAFISGDNNHGQTGAGSWMQGTVSTEPAPHPEVTGRPKANHHTRL